MRLMPNKAVPGKPFQRRLLANNSVCVSFIKASVGLLSPLGGWDRVIAGTAKGLASSDTLQRQPTALEPAMNLQRFQSKGRASGLIATIMPDPRREDQTIGAYGRCKNPEEQWVQLVEKAYAKLCGGNYACLDGGSVADALTDASLRRHAPPLGARKTA